MPRTFIIYYLFYYLPSREISSLSNPVAKCCTTVAKSSNAICLIQSIHCNLTRATVKHECDCSKHHYSIVMSITSRPMLLNKVGVSGKPSVKFGEMGIQQCLHILTDVSVLCRVFVNRGVLKWGRS